MESRISIITLGVKDLEKTYRFYHDGLKFPTRNKPKDGIVFFQTHGTWLALYPYDELAKDVSDKFLMERSKFSGITLAHNTRTQKEVDDVLSLAEKAGAKIEKPGQKTFWGGYSGYFSDPDGYLWEVAYGAFPLNDDGSLRLSEEK